MNFIIISTIILLTSIYKVDCTICFSCGYLEWNGTRLPLDEGTYGNISECGDWATNSDNTVMAGLVCRTYYKQLVLLLIFGPEENSLSCFDFYTFVLPQDGCCSSFRYQITDDKTGDVMWISRHGTAADKDEIWTNFTCGGEVKLV